LSYEQFSIPLTRLLERYTLSKHQHVTDENLALCVYSIQCQTLMPSNIQHAALCCKTVILAEFPRAFVLSLHVTARSGICT